MNKPISTYLFMGALFPIVYYLAFLLAKPYTTAGYTSNATQTDPTNLVAMVLVMAVGTVILLFLPRITKEKEWGRYIFIGLISYSTLDIVTVVIQPYFSGLWITVISTVIVITVAVLLIGDPEWYVIDAVAVCLGASATASLGMSLSVELTIVLLIGLLIYDAIAVYRSRHMIQLAKNILKMKLPVIMIIPSRLSYSYLKDGDPFSNDSKHDAYIMGLGDMVFPGILVVSAQANVQNPIVTLSTVVGIMVGFAGVSYFVSKGKPQAGLPFLCTGAILGFVVSSFLIFGRVMI